MTTASTHCLRCGVPEGHEHHRGCGQPPATPERIRAILAAAGYERADPEARLRQLAARQAAEARSQAPTGPPAALPDDVRIPIPRQQPCPGEFGSDRQWHEHCPATRPEAAP